MNDLRNLSIKHLEESLILCAFIMCEENDYGFFSNARIVPKQKVLDKVVLPRVGVNPNQIVPRSSLNANFEQVSQAMYGALAKREQIMQANLQSTLNVVRGVTGVATQKTGTKLNNKNKKR